MPEEHGLSTRWQGCGGRKRCGRVGGVLPHGVGLFNRASGDFHPRAVVVMLGLAQGSYAVDGQLTELDRWSSPAVFRAL